MALRLIYQMFAKLLGWIVAAHTEPASSYVLSRIRSPAKKIFRGLRHGTRLPRGTFVPSRA
jgi:hypothetical protein